MISFQSYAIGVATFVLLLLGSYVMRLNHDLADSRSKERALALEYSNTVAQHDTTHNLTREVPQVAEVVGSAVRVFGKRVVQQAPARDELDSALGSEHVAEYPLRLAVRKLDAVVQEIQREKADTPFHIRDEPFTVDALLSRPETDSIRLAVHVVLDTLVLRARLHCSSPGEAGIREASLVVSAPPWAAVRIGDVQQDPGICNRPAHEHADEPKRLISWAPVAVTVGKQIGAGNKGWTAQIGTGLVIGR